MTSNERMSTCEHPSERRAIKQDMEPKHQKQEERQPTSSGSESNMTQTDDWNEINDRLTILTCGAKHALDQLLGRMVLVERQIELERQSDAARILHKEFGAKIQRTPRRRNCHNCGKRGHIKAVCWLPGGGAHFSQQNAVPESGRRRRQSGNSKRSTQEQCNNQNRIETSAQARGTRRPTQRRANRATTRTTAADRHWWHKLEHRLPVKRNIGV